MENYETISSIIEKSVKKIVTDFPVIEKDTHFFDELGIDSVEIVELNTALKKNIKEILSKDFNAISFENYVANPTIAQLTEHIHKNLNFS